jgi:hypothetical protein
MSQEVKKAVEGSIIRDASPWELGAVVDLAIEALEIDAFEEMVIDREKVTKMCRNCISSGKHKAVVAEVDGVITGVAAAMVYPQAVYERSVMNIVMWYCKSFGDGVKMMDCLIDWADTRPMIKSIHYHGEREGGAKTTQFLCKRYGFRSDSPLAYRM